VNSLIIWVSFDRLRMCVFGRYLMCVMLMKGSMWCLYIVCMGMLCVRMSLL